jgi:thiol-disulfide isomerase/thioredoxin
VITLALRALLALAGVGDGPADLSGLAWIDERPELQGKVTLVRWWTNGCPLCAGSAPQLSELSKKALVLAIYHPKPPRDVSAEQVRDYARAIRMPGLLAVDRDWKVLDRWMPPEKRTFTSLTFVLDKKGKVRIVHPGGEVTVDQAKELSRKIDALLAEE